MVNATISIQRHCRLAGLMLGAAAAAFAVPASASSVRAGTQISNTATATFGQGGGTTTITSNTVSLRVDELLDVAIAPRETAPVSVNAGASGQVLAFTVTNAGNGDEAFSLAALGTVTGNAFDPSITQLAIDTNNDGQYEPGVDTVVSAGGATPLLAPDGSVTVFVVSTIPAGATDGQHGQLRLTASAVTGSGNPGTVFAGQGSGGGDAVVGATRAMRDAVSGFVVSQATVSFVKSAAVVDPYGGTRALPGAIITWRLVASVTGSGSIVGLRATDNIPAGTTYQSGSLTLDGAALSDAADSDAGAASASGIDVALGTVSAGASRTIEFKTRIN